MHTLGCARSYRLPSEPAVSLKSDTRRHLSQLELAVLWLTLATSTADRWASVASKSAPTGGSLCRLCARLQSLATGLNRHTQTL